MRPFHRGSRRGARYVARLRGHTGFGDTYYSYPEKPGELGPVFDPKSTPSKDGILTNLFRQRLGVLLSIHATHSLAAHGPWAGEVAADHYRWESPTGPGTPYMRLIGQKSGRKASTGSTPGTGSIPPTRCGTATPRCSAGAASLWSLVQERPRHYELPNACGQRPHGPDRNS